MNYDITFCEGENCQRKEQCHRYRELQRFRADKRTMTRPKNSRRRSVSIVLTIIANTLITTIVTAHRGDGVTSSPLKLKRNATEINNTRGVRPPHRLP